MFSSARMATWNFINSWIRSAPLAAVFTLILLFGGGDSAQGAFNVSQSGNTLTVTGPIANPTDYAFFIGAGSGKVHVVDSGVYMGLFDSVQHIDVDVWGGNKVVVRLLAVEITGDVTIATGDGSDGILLVYNDIGGSVVKGGMGSVLIDTGGGDDLLDAQHNTFHGSFDVDTGEGADDVSLYDNLINGTAAFQTGAGNDELKVGYDHAKPVYPANEIHGDLYADTAEGQDIVEVALNAIAGTAILDTGTGSDDVIMRQNRIGGNAELISGDGFDWFQVYTNEVDLDIWIDMGAGIGNKYLYIKDENRVRGNLMINIGDCWGSIVDVIENEVWRDMTITTGSGMTDIDVSSNILDGNAIIDTTDPALLLLESNELAGKLAVYTGAGGDSVDLMKNSCKGDVSISVGGGDDELSLGDPLFMGVYPNDFNASLAVDGGAGFDSLFHDPFNNYAVPPSSQGFESIFP